MKINTHNIITQLAGILIIIVITFNFINIKTNVDEINDIKKSIIEINHSIELINEDIIRFNNMHNDHYYFEEYKVLELIDKDKLNNYKLYLDSIKLNNNF